MSSTRDRLLDAALVVLARDGIAGSSARVIAREADVNQALVFYHYGSVDGLLAEAARQVSHQRADHYVRRLARVGSFAQLAGEARVLHREERDAGHLAVLTQLLAGAPTRPHLVPALQDNFALLSAPVESTLRRLLDGTVLDGIVDPGPLARGIAGGFLGLQLLDDVVTDIEGEPFDALDALAGLLDLALEAGTIERALVRRRLRRVRDRGAAERR